MQNVKIERAERLGLCSGVRRAIKLLRAAAGKYGEIETLGPVAHNRLLVEALANLGVRTVNDVDEAHGKVLAITTHGVGPAVYAQIKARQIHIIDTTCPIVRKAQKAAKELTEAGLDVVIFGDAEHSEVKGLVGWTGDRGIAALNVKQMRSSGRTPSRLGVISQTTQIPLAFTTFVKQLVAMAGPDIQEIRMVNTLCKVTRGQQEAAIRLARRAQLMIVMGGASSANARHLVEVCSPLSETHLVETANEVEASWLLNKRHIGITAGASTPDEAVEQLIGRLKALES